MDESMLILEGDGVHLTESEWGWVRRKLAETFQNVRKSPVKRVVVERGQPGAIGFAFYA